ncbi:hypothetical protein HY489_06190 [Candidatus Woesearchaeota archaeon]|nr:hypothetical protein [Candidatus Woesearchaeota archaeon]
MKKTKTAKTKSPQKTLAVRITTKLLGKAPETKSFNLHDGRKIRTVLELIDELETMSEEHFKQYVNEAENHFSNWIEHVFENKELADEIRHVHNRIDAQRAILKKLVKELIR